MKKFKIFALFAAIMTLAACSSSEDIANNVNNDDKMNINVTRTATNDQFADGDKITVVNLTRLDAGFPNHKATFSYSSNDHSWAKVSGALLWHKTKGVTANELYATMPYNASYDRYSIPTDQSSDDKLKSADWQVDYNKVDLGQNVGFNLHHLLSKVTIDVSLDLEEDIKASVVSKYTDCTGTRNSDGTYTISSSNTTPPSPQKYRLIKTPMRQASQPLLPRLNINQAIYYSN